MDRLITLTETKTETHGQVRLAANLFILAKNVKVVDRRPVSSDKFLVDHWKSSQNNLIQHIDLWQRYLSRRSANSFYLCIKSFIATSNAGSIVANVTIM